MRAIDRKVRLDNLPVELRKNAVKIVGPKILVVGAAPTIPGKEWRTERGVGPLRA